MTIRYIILNGPPQSGKTSICRELIRELNTYPFYCVQDSFAAPMKHFIATALGEKYTDMNKEKPRAELNGYSVREFLIDLSENYIKSRYGNDAFGRWFAHRCARYPTKMPDFVLSDDAGFQAELDAIPNSFVVRVTRPGTDFSNDSRSYFSRFDYEIQNDGDLCDLWIKVKTVSHFIKENTK